MSLNNTPSAERLHIGIFGKPKCWKIQRYQCFDWAESCHCV